MKYSEIFKDNENYKVLTFKNKDEWRKARQFHIGGSDASVILGMNKWTTEQELYEQKVLHKLPKDKTNPAMKYGNDLEPLLRDTFKIDYKDKYKVLYKKDTMFVSNKNDKLAYSPDGMLWDKVNKKIGILEIKTTSIHNKDTLYEWTDGIPNNYYCQILHGMMITNADFVVLIAQIKFDKYLVKNNKTKEIREYIFNREEVMEDIDFLRKEEEKWINDHIINKKDCGIKISL